MAQLLGIARRAQKRAVMETLDRVEVTVGAGVEGDFRGKPGKRQVTLMSREAWQATCDDLGEDLPWTTRRANLLVEGLALDDTAGKQIKIGDLILEITRETDPCERMDVARQGLLSAMIKDWRGGVCCRVISSGKITVGDKVEIIDAE